MGSSSTKAVGGVPVSQTAQNYTNFLGSALSSGSGAQNAIQSLLQGSNSAGNTSVNDFLNQLKNYQPSTVAAPVSNVDLSQGLGTSGTQTPDLTGLLNQLKQTITPQASTTSGSFQAPDLTNLLSQLGQHITAPGSSVNTTTQSNIDPAMASALSSIINTQQSNDINKLREGFTANGAGAGIGTPAAYAEAVYRAQAAPQLANAIGQLGLQSRQLNQTDVGNALSQASTNQAGNLQAASLNSSNLANALQSILSGASLNSSNQLGNRQLDVSQNQNNASNALNASQLNSQNTATALQSLLNQFSTSSQNQTANRGLDINQLAQMLAQSQGNASNVLSAANMNNQSSQFGQSNLMNIAQLLSGNQQSANQGQLGILAQLFGGLNQANALGTSQAQTVQTPSFLSQLVTGLSSLAQTGGALATGIGTMKGATP